MNPIGRWTQRALPLMVTLAVAACGSSAVEPTPSPTAIQRSTPASTPTPTPTAIPTPSPIANERPSPPMPSPSAGLGGWHRVEIAEEGFAISLPPNWEAFDLTSGEIEQLIGRMGGDERFGRMRDQIAPILQAGGALFALNADAAGMEAGFLTNVNVIVQEDINVPLSLFSAASISFVQEQFGVEVKDEEIGLPASDAVRISYELTETPAGGYHVTQYMLMSDTGDAYIVTFSRPIGTEFEAQEETFEASMQTFEFLP